MRVILSQTGFRSVVPSSGNNHSRTNRDLIQKALTNISEGLLQVELNGTNCLEFTDHFITATGTECTIGSQIDIFANGSDCTVHE